MMFGKISKKDFSYLLLNSKSRISNIFDLLDEVETLDILSYLYYNKVDFGTLKSDLSDVDIELLSSYVVKLLDFGIIEIKKDEIYQLSKTGRKFLELTVQLVFESYLDDEIVDEKMQKIFIQHVGKKELTNFKEERKKNKAKGYQLSWVWTR